VAKIKQRSALEKLPKTAKLDGAVKPVLCNTGETAKKFGLTPVVNPDLACASLGINNDFGVALENRWVPPGEFVSRRLPESVFRSSS